MYRITQRIHDGRHIVGDVVRQLKCVVSRDNEVLGKGTRAVDPNTIGIAAQMTASSTTVAAVTTGNMPLTGYTITDFKAAHAITHGGYFTHVFVAYNHRHWNRFL